MLLEHGALRLTSFCSSVLHNPGPTALVAGQSLQPLTAFNPQRTAACSLKPPLSARKGGPSAASRGWAGGSQFESFLSSVAIRSITFLSIPKKLCGANGPQAPLMAGNRPAKSS